MIKKTFIALLLMTATIATAFAQRGVNDIIYLKNGSILKGMLIEQLPDSIVKIEIAGGSIFVVTMAELDHIVYRQKTDPSKVKPIKAEAIARKSKGYFNISQMGLLPGSSSNYDYYWYYSAPSVGFTVQSIHGYRFNPHFLAGAGLALDIIDNSIGQLFLDGRYEILDKKTTPFIYGDFGYGVPLNKKYEDESISISYKGGITAGGGVGMRMNFRNEGAFIMEVGYKMEKYSQHYDYQVWGEDITNKFTFNRLAIRMGLAF
ncbi:MAG: hypothetical protein IPG01_10215 [Chitinophagaceae bacterium]|nr:hypothetical protein [Chitinophagaceae bacterium]